MKSLSFTLFFTCLLTIPHNKNSFHCKHLQLHFLCLCVSTQALHLPQHTAEEQQHHRSPRAECVIAQLSWMTKHTLRLDVTQNLLDLIIYSMTRSSLKYLWCQKSKSKAFACVGDFLETLKLWKQGFENHPSWRQSALKKNSIKYLKFPIDYELQYIPM